MIRHARQSVFLVAMTLPLLFGGCGTQVRQTEPIKQETPVRAEGKEGVNTSSPTNTVAQVLEHPEAAEELPVVAEENTVFFTLGSAALGHPGRQKLETISERLVSDRTLHVLVVGYANDNGSSSFNLAVSDNRVVSVAAFLRKRGVHSEQIRVQALGSEKTPASCRSSKCRQHFRRVDLVVSSTKK